MFYIDSKLSKLHLIRKMIRNYIKQGVYLGMSLVKSNDNTENFIHICVFDTITKIILWH